MSARSPYSRVGNTRPYICIYIYVCVCVCVCVRNINHCMLQLTKSTFHNLFIRRGPMDYSYADTILYTEELWIIATQISSYSYLCMNCQNYEGMAFTNAILTQIAIRARCECAGSWPALDQLFSPLLDKRQFIKLWLSHLKSDMPKWLQQSSMASQHGTHCRLLCVGLMITREYFMSAKGTTSWFTNQNTCMDSCTWIMSSDTNPPQVSALPDLESGKDKNMT